MNKPYQFLLALGIAAASLSSCSRANYAVNTTTAPTSESVQIALPASDAAASGTASVSAAMPAEVVAPAREAAAALAHHAAPAEAKAVKTAAAVAAPAEAAAPKATVTKAERKALRQAVKRQLANAPKSTSAEGKSQLVAALLCFFLGGLGIHDFYLGYTGKGILQIFLTLLFGIGFILVIIDLIRILTGNLKPKGGEYAKKL